jgi:hypothetical protein
MEPSKSMYKKLDFFKLYDNLILEHTFDEGSQKAVSVRITGSQMDSLDKKLIMVILNEGSKVLGNDSISCFIKKSTLTKRLGIVDSDLLERMRKLMRIRAEEFSKERDLDFSFCELKYSTENGKTVEYEVKFNKLAVLKKYFNKDFIEHLLNNVDTGPTGAHMIVVDGEELIFLSYRQAADYGEKELLPKKINYSIYHLQTRQLVLFRESLKSGGVI